jgi:hypothetical protein
MRKQHHGKKRRNHSGGHETGLSQVLVDHTIRDGCVGMLGFHCNTGSAKEVHVCDECACGTTSRVARTRQAGGDLELEPALGIDESATAEQFASSTDHTTSLICIRTARKSRQKKSSAPAKSD